MIRLRYDKDVRALPLLLALQAAGVPVRQVLPWAGYAEVEVEDGADAATIAAVVAAHDPAALDQADAQARQARALVRQAIVAYPGKAGPTAAETVAAVKALCLAVAALYQDN